MKINQNSFYSQVPPNEKSFWSDFGRHGDTPTNFLKYSEKNPNWHYASSENVLSYNRNSDSARNDFDYGNRPKDFFLATGCSHTEGVGLYAEEIWCSQLSRMVECPVYNAGMGGSGIDIASHNIINLIGRGAPYPKKIIWQMADVSRFTIPGYPWQKLFKDDHETEVCCGSFSGETPIRQMLGLMSVTGFDTSRAAKSIYMVSQICELLNIPLILYNSEFNVYNDDSSLDEKMRLIQHMKKTHVYTITKEEFYSLPNDDDDTHVMYARDRSHFGPSIHNVVAKYLHREAWNV